MNSDQEVNLASYLQISTLEVVRKIGFGIHGSVFEVSSGPMSTSVVKVFEDDSAFAREKAVYLRLQDKNISKINEFSVPELLNADDELLILQISLVPRPFVLGFASAYLDELPAWFPPLSREWWADKEN